MKLVGEWICLNMMDPLMVLFPWPAFFGSVAGANRNVRPIVLLCELESFAWRQCRVGMDSAWTALGLRARAFFIAENIWTEVLKTMPWNEVPNVKAKSLLSFASCVYIYSTIFNIWYTKGIDFCMSWVSVILSPLPPGAIPPFSWLVKPHFLFVWSSFSEILRLNNIPRGFQWLPLLWVKSFMLGSVRR